MTMSSHYYPRDIEASVTLTKVVGVIDTGDIGEEAKSLWIESKELEPSHIFAQCKQVLEWLQGHGIRVAAKVKISTLLDAIDGWEQEDVRVYKNGMVNLENN